jgi:ketosteroid isomerase-like protein
MSQENVELVRALYAEWEKGNFGAMAELYAPDVEWHWSSGARALRGGSASYKGLTSPRRHVAKAASRTLVRARPAVVNRPAYLKGQMPRG